MNRMRDLIHTARGSGLVRIVPCPNCINQYTNVWAGMALNLIICFVGKFILLTLATFLFDPKKVS